MRAVALAEDAAAAKGRRTSDDLRRTAAKLTDLDQDNGPES